MSTSQNNHAIAAQNHSGAEVDERQIEATLAVAYETRTANLLAFRAVAGQIIVSGAEITVEFAMQVDAVDAQILERLGLE